jgi:hypothetical protein
MNGGGGDADPFAIPDFLQRPMAPPQPVAAVKALAKVNGKVTVEHAAPAPQGNLLAKLEEVKGRDPALAYSQDNARQLDLLHHTSEGMGAEEASYHITDMMKALGKNVRNRDDHAAYIQPFIRSQDTLAAEISRVTGIPLEKLVPNFRAIGTHGPDAVKAFRERLQEFEPERASRIAEVLSDQRIKQIWRSKGKEAGTEAVGPVEATKALSKVQAPVKSDLVAEQLKTLKSLELDNDAFDKAVAAIKADKSITERDMRALASEYLGYSIKKNRQTSWQAIVDRQAVDARQRARKPFQI